MLGEQGTRSSRRYPEFSEALVKRARFVFIGCIALPPPVASVQAALHGTRHYQRWLWAVERVGRMTKHTVQHPRVGQQVERQAHNIRSHLFSGLVRSVHPLTACRSRVFTVEARPGAAKILRTLDAGAQAAKIAENVTVAEVV